jgi:tripartite-type tricarboxylate transporter receptor subunit TctC
MKRYSGLVATFVATAVVLGAGIVPAADNFLDKGLTLVVASDVGGGYDVYSRVLQRYYPAHLPGKPNIVVQNKPGASGMTATNWAYAVAPKDGATILATYSALIDQNLLGNKSAQYDVKKFNWIGSIAASPLICVTWHTSPYKDIRQMIGKPITVSATGMTGKGATYPLMLNEVLGTQFKVITGYSTEGTTLALERGEVDAICGTGLSTLQGSQPDWFLEKKINIVAQSGLFPVAELKDVPNVLDLVAAKDRPVLEYGAILEAMGRPYLAPPGVPEDRLQVLRSGFDATMKDKAFLAEMEKLRLGVSPMTAREMEIAIDKLYGYSKETIERVQRLTSGKS